MRGSIEIYDLRVDATRQDSASSSHSYGGIGDDSRALLVMIYPDH